MKRFFTADLHLGHANVIRYAGRPYSSVEQMDDDLVARWNDLVDPTDEVWVLGDVAMGRIADSLARVAVLHGTKHLIAGNHDRVHPTYRTKDPDRWVAAYRDAGFASIAERARLDIGGVDVLLCHFPRRGDSHDEDRFPEHRPTDWKGWLLHGHVHESWRQRDRQVNVGVDAWAYRPVVEDEIVALLDAGPHHLAPLLAV